MSCITENTIMVTKQAENDLLRDLSCDASVLCRINGIKKVYGDDRHVIYIFDCNGDQPWDIVDRGKLSLREESILCTETAYGPGELWTRVRCDTGLYDTDTEMKELIKPYMPKDEYDVVVKSISYSI